ncbi:Uncharacterised protein [Burkholderia pseudomallei]|nr:Uncharacterised protein [Burkholderia pseudomallei]
MDGDKTCSARWSACGAGRATGPATSGARPPNRRATRMRAERRSRDDCPPTVRAPAGARRCRRVRRHDDRVVRLLHLRDRRRARVRRVVLSVGRPVRQHDGFVRHVRGRLFRAAARRRRVRPSRRPDRPQEGADDDARDDGRGDRVHRPVAEPCVDRCARAGAARAAADRAGRRGGRRVGRRGADGGRARARGGGARSSLRSRSWAARPG